MIFVDIETTGLDPEKCAILSIGGVESGNPSNKFYVKCAPWKDAVVTERALEVNGFDPEQIWQIPNSQYEALIEFDRWARLSCRDGIIAGHNFQRFDYMFLENAYRREFNLVPTIYHSVMDLMDLYRQSDLYDSGRARLDDLLANLGLPPEPIPHHALRGAVLELEAYSRLINKRPVFRKSYLYGTFRL